MSCFIHCTVHKRGDAKARNVGSIQSQTPRDDNDDDHHHHHDCDENDDNGVDETSKSKQKT